MALESKKKHTTDRIIKTKEDGESGSIIADAICKRCKEWTYNIHFIVMLPLIYIYKHYYIEKYYCIFTTTRNITSHHKSSIRSREIISTFHRKHLPFSSSFSQNRHTVYSVNTSSMTSWISATWWSFPWRRQVLLLSFTLRPSFCTHTDLLLSVYLSLTYNADKNHIYHDTKTVFNLEISLPAPVSSHMAAVSQKYLFQTIHILISLNLTSLNRAIGATVYIHKHFNVIQISPAKHIKHILVLKLLLCRKIYFRHNTST